MSKKIGRQAANEKGAVALMVAILLSVFLGVAALAVDVGYMMVARNQLQDIADAAALAGARWLGHNYEGMTYAEQLAFVCDPSVIGAVVADVGNKNDPTGAGSFVINGSEIVIGTWDASTKTLTATNNAPDAVRVTVRRDDSTNGPITTFFAKIFGRNTVNVSAMATAALTSQSTAGPGALPLPAGISNAWNSWGTNPCGQQITFYPSNSPTSCAGWNVYDQSPANDKTLRDTLNALKAGTYTSPPVDGGQTQFTFTGGTMSQQTFNAMQAYFDANKGPDGTWTTAVPVYSSPDCGNPTGNITIVGFATIKITQVVGAPTKTIVGEVVCNDIAPGRGGGGNYGTLGSIPGLVQ